jgi:hypothetical protein
MECARPAKVSQAKRQIIKELPERKKSREEEKRKKEKGRKKVLKKGREKKTSWKNCKAGTEVRKWN